MMRDKKEHQGGWWETKKYTRGDDERQNTPGGMMGEDREEEEFTGDTHAPQGQEAPILFRWPTISHQLKAYDVAKVGSNGVETEMHRFNKLGIRFRNPLKFFKDVIDFWYIVMLLNACMCICFHSFFHSLPFLCLCPPVPFAGAKGSMRE